MRRISRRAKFAGFTGFLLSVAIGFDQLGNALLGGDPDDTMSARCGAEVESLEDPSWWCEYLVCPVTEFFDEGHCENAQE